MASFGLRTPEQGACDGDGELWLWPDNRPAWDLWRCLQTQWRVGMGGATGLDYGGVQAAMQLLGIKHGQRTELFALVCAMEHEVLQEWAQQAERDARR